MYNPRTIFHPHLYDALSGPFRPANSDRIHTLARLAVATLDRGDGYSTYNRGRAFAYNPSWAPETQMTVECDEGAIVRVVGVKSLLFTNFLVANLINPLAEGPKKFAVSGYIGEVNGYTPGHEIEERVYGLSSGEAITSAQQEIAKFALSLYDAHLKLASR